MDRRAFIVAMGAAAAAGPLRAQTSDEEAIDRAIRRGRLIYAFDRAAWVGTDALKRQISDPKSLELEGYVVEPVSEGLLRATWYKLEGDAPRAGFIADVRQGAVQSSHLLKPTDNGDMSDLATRMAEARADALDDFTARRLEACAQAPFNTVVLPPEHADAPTPVYFLTPQTKAGDFPFGGHYEIDIAPTGAVVFERPFTKSCFTISQAAGAPPSGASKGAKSISAFVTHVLDPTPTEIHVYLSLWMKQPVYVATSTDRVWVVDGDKIRLDTAKTTG